MDEDDDFFATVSLDSLVGPASPPPPPPPPTVYDLFARELLENLPTTRRFVQTKTVGDETVAGFVTMVPVAERRTGDLVVNAEVDDVQIQGHDHLGTASLVRGDRLYRAWVIPVRPAGHQIRLWTHRIGGRDVEKRKGSISGTGVIKLVRVACGVVLSGGSR